MPAPIVWIFVILSSTFASVHNFAIAASLYWYYSWFDIVMHFWGGFLIVLGVFSLCTFHFVPFKPSFRILLGTLVLVMISWEIFERVAGLYDPVTYIFDVSKDLVVGLCGGLTGYLVLKRFTI